MYAPGMCYNKSHCENLSTKHIPNLNFKPITILVRIHLRFSKTHSNMDQIVYSYIPTL